MLVNSNNEWDSLKTVIVGSVDGKFSMGVDLSFKLFFKDSMWGYALDARKKIEVKQLYIDELKEDLDEYVETLQHLGVKVLRPDNLHGIVQIQTPDFKTEALPALNVRDQSIIIGDTIVETAPMQRSRYFENDLLKDIFDECFCAGANWLQMPKATLSNKMLYEDLGMMIDGAQFVRFGQDIIVNVTTQQHFRAVCWMRRQFPEYNFHAIDFVVENHLDSYIVPLCEGTLLLRDSSIVPLLPEFLKDWKIIYPPEPTIDQFPVYSDEEMILTSPYIDMNVLSVDGDKIITNELYPELNEVLYKEGFTPVPVQHRHRRIFGGGFHCFTLDLLRN